MVKNGSYRVYEIHHHDGVQDQVLVARFMIQNRCFTILEDHTGLLSDSLTEGPVTEAHDKFIKLIHHSGYFKLIPEQQIAQGMYDDLIEDADWSDIKPEARYLLIGEGEPLRVETYGDSIVVNGKQLPNEEVDAMMKEVRSGKARLLPV